MTDHTTETKQWVAPVWLGVLLLVTGLLGLLGAFALSVERINLLLDPTHTLACDVNPFISCGGAMTSEQGSLFGFPNSLIGLMAFPASIIMGVLTLARVAFPRWVWGVFSLGVLGGLVFVLWLATQSIFVLGLVCPWCFLVWVTMYAMSFPLWGWVLGEPLRPPGALGAGLVRVKNWGWVASLATLTLILVLIMMQLPEIPRFLISQFG